MESVQHLKRIIDTMERTSVEIVEKKRAAFREGEESVVKQLGMGKDIMSVLRELSYFRLTSSPVTYTTLS